MLRNIYQSDMRGYLPNRMKKEFFDIMLKVMGNNPDVYLLFGDLGYPRVDEFLEKFPSNAFNVGASEQSMMDIAVGLAYEGKIPFTYTITPFYWRAAETLRTYLDHEKLPCVLIGVGVDEEYGEHDGFSHSATDIKQLFNILKNFNQYYPDSLEELKKSIDEAIRNKEPNFINIHR